MSRFYAKFYNRSFAPMLALPDVRIVPRQWGSVAIGGPEFAQIEVYGPEAALWQTTDWLRYGVEIYNELGTAVWWGYVESVELIGRAVSVSLSLEDLANSVKVEYGEGNTGFTEDADSVAEYGRKQKVLSVDAALADSASQRGAVELSYSKEPRAIQDIRRNDEPHVLLRCVGWLKTLSWLYYSRADGMLEYTGTGSVDQVLGMGLTASTLWFQKEQRRINDTSAGLRNLKQGMTLHITGSASNNTIYTVQTGTERGASSVTSSLLSFTNGATLYSDDAPQVLGWLAPDDIIRVSNTLYNNGWYRVTRVAPQASPPEPVGAWIEATPNFTSEYHTAGNVIQRGHWIELAEEPVEEMPGATVTITVDGSKIGQQFRPSTAWSAYSAWVKLRKVGTPGDSVSVSIYTDSGGVPGTSLGNASVSAAGISANSAWTEFIFSTPVALTGGTTYWLIVERTGGLSVTDYYAVAVDEDAGYGDGYLRLWTGSGWVARGTEADLLFRIEGQEQTTDQISSIVTDSGQFLTGSTIDDASGINTNQYRQGAVDALTELTDLLDIGTTNARRLLCEVRQDRKLRVWEEPAYSGTPDIVRRMSGEIMTVNGVALQPGELVTGQWMHVETPLRTAEGLSADPTLFFIERMAYDAERNEYTVTPRGAPNIWRLAAIPRT